MVPTQEQVLRGLCEWVRRAAASGMDRPVESVLGQHPSLARDEEAILELLYAEFTEREDRGELPTARELVARFPWLSDRFERLLHVHSALQAGEDGALPPAASESRTTHGLIDTLPQVPLAQPAKVRRIGIYELREVIGRGGMGVVHKAFQTGLDRIVALKLIYRSPGDEESHRRFLMEARTAANLHHPNIVAVHEVGDNGDCFYLAMEHIDGGSLDQRLAEAALSPILASQMMTKLSAAVHYAHERGVIHRDLKPANVLLAENDEPKIADFGVARQVSLDAPDPSERTRTGVILGTPSYMAPEQANSDSPRIGPPCDIYGLGAVLYEMLTGRPPFLGETALETLDQLRHEEPIPPSRLRRRLPRNLENICLKCLEKDPRRRYATAKELENDLNRFLRGEPVRARPVGVSLRAWHWCRRRPATAALVVMIVACVTALGIGGPWIAWKQAMLRTVATQKTREAETVTSFLIDAFKSSDPRSDGDRATIAEKLDEALELINERFAKDFATKSSLLQAFAESYLGQGRYEKAVSVATQAVDASRSIRDGSVDDTLRAEVLLAECLFEAGQLREARELLERAGGGLRSQFGTSHPLLLKAQAVLAQVLETTGDAPRGVVVLEDAHAAAVASLGINDPITTELLIQLATALRRSGQASRSLELLVNRREQLEARLGANNMLVLDLMSALASAHRAMDQFEQARPLYEESLARLQSKLGQNHPRTLTAMNNFAAMLVSAGDYEHARDLCRHVLDTRTEVLGVDHPLTLASKANLANALWFNNESAEARTILEELVQQRTARFGEADVQTLESIRSLGDVLAELGEWQASVELLEPALERCRAKLDAEDEVTLAIAHGLAKAYGELEQAERGIQLLSEAVSHARRKYGPGHTITTACMHTLASLLRKSDKFQQAFELQQSVVAFRVSSYGPSHPGTLTARIGLGQILTDLKEVGPAEREFRAVLADGAQQGATHALTLYAQCELGSLLLRTDRSAEGTALLAEGCRELAMLPEASLPFGKRQLRRFTGMLATSGTIP